MSLIEYGLKHPEIKDQLREYIQRLGKKFEAEDKRKNK